VAGGENIWLSMQEKQKSKKSQVLLQSEFDQSISICTRDWAKLQTSLGFAHRDRARFRGGESPAEVGFLKFDKIRCFFGFLARSI
jgi:hypothetical protein